MKKRANRLLALLMSAAMVATPYASVTPVFAENVEESADFFDGEEIADSQEEQSLEDAQNSSDDLYAGETDGSVAEEDADVFSDGEDAGFFVDAAAEDTEGQKEAADTIVGKAYSIKATVLNSTGGVSGMYGMDSIVVTMQENGSYLVRMHQTSVNREILALTDDQTVANRHNVPWYHGNGDDGFWFTFPVASLTESLHFCMLKEANLSYLPDPPQATKGFSNIQTLTFDLSSMQESEEKPASAEDINKMAETENADYTAVDAALASIPEDLSVYTDETVAAVNAAKAAIVRNYGKDKQAEVDKMAEDLNAAIKALVLKDTPVETTELTTQNTTGMFKVTNAALLTTANGTVLQFTLGSTGYEYIFKGTYEEAVSNGNNRDSWVKYELTNDGAYQFTIPVSEGETYIPLVSISKNKLSNFANGTGTLENAFYARQLVIDYAGKTLTAGDYDHTASLTVDKTNAGKFTAPVASLHTIASPAANNYSETLELTMGSPSFDKIYVGNALAADEADVEQNALTIDAEKKVNIQMSKNEKGGVSLFNYLEQPLLLSFHSVKNNNWNSRKLFTVSKVNGSLTIVDYKPATAVSLDQTEAEVVEGQSFDLTATVTPEKTSDVIKWSSSNEKVATVKDGKVTGVSEGTAQITVTVGAISATCNVTVVKKDFKYTVQALVTNGTTRSKNATDVVATATDGDGNVVKASVNASKMLEFAALDATKTYTICVSRDGYYPVTEQKVGSGNGTYKFTATGEWEYTATISRADADKQIDVIFQKDQLKAAIKEVPSDFSSYTEESVSTVQEVLNSVDQESKDWTKRDEDAARLREALNGLKIVKDGEYAPDVTVSTGLAMLEFRLIVEDGEMKARFVGSSASYAKIYMGSSADAKKAADTDPNMFLPESELLSNCNGYQGYQFTIPVSGLAKEIPFSVCTIRSGKAKWSEQTFSVSSSNLKPYVEVKEISLNKTEEVLDAGKTLTLKETINPEDASHKTVFWKSSDTKVATVTGGVVKGLKEGTATITVSNGFVSAECNIAVHTFETLPAVDATCTETGLTEGIRCKECGAIIKEQEVLPALGHKEIVTIPGKAATCTKKGLTDEISCSVCGKVLHEQVEIPALGHKEEILPAIAATCTKDGWSEGKKCSVCGLILKSRKLIKATGHKEEIIPAVAATPGHTGLTQGKKCSVCGEILEEQKVIPALPILVTKLKVSTKTSAKIAAGKKVQLTVTATPGNAENKAVTWKSSNTKVATVNSKGLVTMKKNAGGKSVVITATAKDGSKVYGKIKLTCMKGVVKKITISGKKTVKAGKSLTLKAKVKATKKANKSIAWSSSNKKLATVSSKGVVKTFKGKKGTVKITAKALDGSGKKATFKIKIK